MWLSTCIPYQLNIVSDYAITQYRTNASEIAHLVRIVCSGLYASAAAEVEKEVKEIDAALNTWLADADPGSGDSRAVVSLPAAAAPESEPMDSELMYAEPPDAEPPDAELSDAEFPDAELPDDVPTDAAPTDAVATDSAPTNTVPTGELGLSSEGLTFIAGYVTAKCRHIDATLGSITSETPGVVTSTWLRAISQGGLTMPAEPWMSTVRDFETLFSLVMGSSVCGEPGIMRRLVDLLEQKRPDLDKRVMRKLVSTRLHVRLRWLNRKRKTGEESAMRRGSKQVRQHVRSGK